MNIKFNNQIIVSPAQCSIQQLLDNLIPEKQNGIAIAVNDVVIPKINWKNHIIEQNDSVLVITATQGG